MLNVPGLIDAAYSFGGQNLVDLFLDVGSDAEIAQQLIEAISERGYVSVFNMLLGRYDASLATPITALVYGEESEELISQTKTSQLKDTNTVEETEESTHKMIKEIARDDSQPLVQPESVTDLSNGQQDTDGLFVPRINGPDLVSFSVENIATSFFDQKLEGSRSQQYLYDDQPHNHFSESNYHMPTSSNNAKSEQMKYIADQEYQPRGNVMVAGTGAAVMKLIEVKESITYLFTEIIPILDKPSVNKLDKPGFVESEGLWSAAHFASGLAFSFAMPEGEAIGIIAKVMAPITGTSSYVLRHYYHSELKQDIFGSEVANSCLYNIAMDAGFGALTSVPIAAMTGNPLLVIYSASQGAAIASLSCFASGNGQDHSLLSTAAANLAAAATIYKFWPFEGLSSNFGSIMFAINKAANMLTGVILIHKTVATITKQIADNLPDLSWLSGYISSYYPRPRLRTC